MNVFLFIAILFCLSTQAQPGWAQSGWAQTTDSSYVAPVCYVPADTLVNRNRFRQTQTENHLLKRQNEHLQNKTARFWGLLLLAALASLAQTVSR